MARPRTAPCVPRIAYMPQGLGRTLSELCVYDNIDFFGRLFGLSPRGAARAHRPPAARHRPGPFPDRPAGKLSGGMKQKLGAVLRAGPRPGPADPRRADHRRRSAVAAAVLGADRRHPRRAAGHERARRHRLHGGGGALRLARRHGRGPVLATGTAELMAARGQRPGRGLHRAAARGQRAATAARPPRRRPTASPPSRPRA